MIHFVGAGPGAEDLITVRGENLLKQADVVVYAGSLVNPAHLARTRAGCEIHDSASMTLEQVMEVMIPASKAGKTVVRLHTGDPSIYGAIREQMDWLDAQAWSMRSVRACRRSAAQRQRCARNIPCRMSARQ